MYNLVNYYKMNAHVNSTCQEIEIFQEAPRNPHAPSPLRELTVLTGMAITSVLFCFALSPKFIFVNTIVLPVF